MAQFYVNNIKDLTSRQVVTGKPIKASDHGSWRSDVRRRISDLNDFLAAHNTAQSGSSQPTPFLRGRLWADTTTTNAVALYVDPDAAGADDQVATRLTGKDISFATGGTATFKMGGAIDVNTTQVSLVGAGDLMTYTVPANTITNGGVIIQRGFFVGGHASSTINHSIGADSLSLSSDLALLDGFAKVICVGVGGVYKRHTIVKLSSDAAGGGDLVENEVVFAQSITANATMKFGSAQTATQEIMLTQYLP